MSNYPTLFIIPTGIRCEIGGFAGDALPTAKLLAAACGCLITHPNVMNGGTLSLNDEKILYVEGFSLNRFAKGEIALRKVNKQRIGIIFDSSIENDLLIRHLQAVDACVATLGICVDSYEITDKPLGIVIKNDVSGVSDGHIANPKSLIKAGEKLKRKGATAIAIVGQFPEDINDEATNLYREGKGVDSISGVEAIISHLVSKFLKIPCAHAPALNPIGLNKKLDPRAASEEIGYTFLPSVLIGLSKAPDLVEIPCKNQEISIHPDQVKSIVAPRGALGGEAVLACMERGLKIIAVDNQCILNVDNEIMKYPNLVEVDNYLEAAGILLTERYGLNLKSLKRPLQQFRELGNI